ncbi:MAG: GNAT family N-acetyltransferase [Planctomycetota bacterium]
MPEIRRFQPDDVEPLLALSLSAFTPIHESFERELGPEVFRLAYPDWRKSHARYFRELCAEDPGHIWVAWDSASHQRAGYVHYTMNAEDRSGEIGLNAIAPAYQGRGIGTSLYRHVLGLMKEHGALWAKVNTGGNPAHAPAVRAYERCGFKVFPLAHMTRLL